MFVVRNIGDIAHDSADTKGKVMQTNLFSFVNKNFFNLLYSGSNNEVHAGCLLVIYNLYDHEVSYKLPRAVVRDSISEYLTFERVKMDEEYNSPNDYANAIIRKFCDVRWVEEDRDDNTYEQQIALTEQGIALAEFMQRLIEPPKDEYSSYIYNIFNTLKNREQWNSDPYVLALKEVYKSSKKLAGSLKKLSTTIRKTIESLVKEETLESLTENLISYCNGDFIKEYSRLIKQQNIHIYRANIRKMMDDLKSPSNYDIIVIGCCFEEELDEEEAAEYVDNMFRTTMRFLTEDYDRIMQSIKKKINIYLTLAIGRAQFLMNHDVNMRGYVEQTMKFLIEEFGDEDINTLLPDETKDLFSIFTQSIVDADSVRYPASSRKIIRASTSENVELSDEDIQQAREQQRREAYNPYSKSEMKNYINNLMGEKMALHADDVPVHNKSDVLAVIACAAYAEENGFLLESSEQYIEKNGFVIRDFTIRRKQAME